MKADLHPKYTEIKVVCSCGNTFNTRSTWARNPCRSKCALPATFLYRPAEADGCRGSRRSVPWRFRRWPFRLGWFPEGALVAPLSFESGHIARTPSQSMSQADQNNQDADFEINQAALGLSRESRARERSA